MVAGVTSPPPRWLAVVGYARVVLKRVALPLVVAFALASCGGDGDEAAERATTTSPSAPPIESPAVGEGQEWIVFHGVSLGFTLIRPDGTGNHVILDELPGDQLHPDWSPDGSRLAFVQATDDATWDIWISDPRGTNPEPLLAEYPAELTGLIWDNPAWSRDGSRIAMIGYDGNPNLELPTRAVLAIVNVATDNVSVPFDFAIDDPVPLLSFPRWAPDGNAIVLTVGRLDKNLNVTGEAIAVTTLAGGTWSTPVVITPFDDFASRPDWHPTDDLIVFGTHDVGGLQSTDKPSNLFTVRPDGNGLTRVTDFGPGEERASQPTWTSDGRIIFTHITGAADEKRDIAFINPDGSSLEGVAGPDAVGVGNRPHPRLRPVP